MNEKTLKTLEFNKIIDLLVQKAASPMGKIKCASLVPMKNFDDIVRAQKETTAATEMILRKGSLPLGGIKDIRAALARANAGGMLQPDELLHVAECLYVFKKIFAYGEENTRGEKNFSEKKFSGKNSAKKNFSRDEKFSNQKISNEKISNEKISSHDEKNFSEKFSPTREGVLENYFSAVTTDDALEKEISRCIKQSGEIADNASQKLGEIRRSIRTAHDKIRDHLGSVIQSAAYKNMLQDAIITLRGDRFCVPVKSEYRGSFPGMVHDQSSTGATVFMEPLSVVDLNNKIKDFHFEEKREEEKILFKLSGLVAGKGDALDANLFLITQLDFIFAKGELSLSMRCTEPIFNTRGCVNIKKGRHPLLKQDSVVPTNIFLGEKFSMLLITGPNTGGKTVALKTIGLFTCMGQAGLHISAFDESELAVFGEVFADIGDEQSIEQSLSTFSSHMKNIIGILENVCSDSLVLLDELGAGTDPTEGAALAIALLSHLHAQKIRTVVTTHYSELKLFALSTDGAENASCEFDVETLRPTYRLLIGIPGKSNAFAITKRLGLPEKIIDDARAFLKQKDIKFEDVITDLETSKKLALIEQDRAEIFRREAEKIREEAAKSEEKLRTQKEKILLQAREEASEIIRNAKKESENLIAEIRKNLSNASRAEVEEARRAAREGLSALESAVAPAPQKPERTPPENLRRGDRVLIHSMNQHGTVLIPPDSGGEVQILAGIMKIKVNIADVSLDEEDPAEKAAAFVKKRVGGGAKSLTISPEIDLRGLMPEDAVAQSERYLDDAFLASLSTVTLIHGKGTGALRNAVHNMLKRQPNVKNFRLGKFGEGEDGVTIVTFFS
ncbi:MAG: endonuclease MutS2 [Defluviitaleaceae bacterium]|nr:endonuclease MutS2 [Defluviitaleaceae bacterium]